MISLRKRPGLVGWQWSLYADGHADRTNLLLHLIAVPLFDLGFLGALLLPALGFSWLFVPAGLALCAASMAVQGRGHAREPVAPVPFHGPIDAVTRILTEQLFTFWRYVLTGGLARALRR